MEATGHYKKSRDYVGMGSKAWLETGINEYRNAIRRRATDKELRNDFPALDNRLTHWKSRVRKATWERQNNRYIADKKVIVLWGEADAEKNKYVYGRHEKRDVFRLSYESKSDAVQFNRYNGQKILIIDEFVEEIPSALLLDLTHGYQCHTEYKGEDLTLNFELIYILSKFDPDGWYKDENLKAILKERITEIKHFMIEIDDDQ